MTVIRLQDRKGNQAEQICPTARPHRAGGRRWAALCCLVLGLTAAACAPRLQPTGPMTGEPSIDGDALIALDGARLPLRR